MPDRETHWSNPALSNIERRSVNKELETKKVLVNIILLLLLRLVEKFARLILLTLDSKLVDFDSQLVWYIRFSLNILFVYNIFTGVRNILKPNDDFYDLDLTKQQRSLLGLPIISDREQSLQNKISPIKLSKLEPQTFTQSANTALSPKKNRHNVLGDETMTTKISVPISPATPSKNKSKTPISSPMSSPSPIKPIRSSLINSPTKTSSVSTSTIASSRLNKKPLNPLLQNSGVFTPTYIPSPKYYYRMDSPTKTRRV